jgi:hypothetical protein
VKRMTWRWLRERTAALSAWAVHAAWQLRKLLPSRTSAHEADMLCKLIVPAGAKKVCRIELEDEGGVGRLGHVLMGQMVAYISARRQQHAVLL